MRLHLLLVGILYTVAGSLAAQSVRYEVPEKPWESGLGTHRAVVRVPAPASVVRVNLPWRRRDPAPEKKGVIVAEAATDQRVDNVLASKVTAEYGDVAFEAKNAGDYFVYYLPGDPGRGAFPKAKYDAPQEPRDEAWKQRASAVDLPNATVMRWEARTEHDRFNEMEIIATAAECEAWMKRLVGPFAVFPEVRERAVRMFDQVPELWLKREKAPEFAVQPNEFYTFQLGVWAGRGELKNLRVTFSDLTGEEGAISSKALRCLQSVGVNWNGKPITHTIDVEAGQVQPLWCALDLGSDVRAGRYSGYAKVEADGQPAVLVPLNFMIGGPVLEDRGDSEPARLTKLRWLDSTIAQDDAPTSSFPPLTVAGHTIELLGRTVTLGESGLPERVATYFHPGVTKLIDQPTEILAAPMRFVVETTDGKMLPLVASGFTVKKSPQGGVAEWTAKLDGGVVTLDVKGRLEFDGHAEIRCALAAKSAIAVRDVRLEIPRTSETTPLILGLGHYSGASPARGDWKWDVAKKHQDAVWLGTVNAGLRVQLRAENYVRPYVNIHYIRQPLSSPASWDNAGLGGITFARGEKETLLECYSGERMLDPARPLHFDFDLSITPFRTLNTAAQWRDRYYHVGGVTDLGRISSMGANVVNIHQGNALNPYINYPFLTANKLRDYAAKVHAEGMRVKYYYTVRELTNWTPELFAARAFGNELIARGKGEGHAWCEEHLGGEYWQAWAEPGVNDSSILTASLSRWNNLYLEGLDWLTKNAGCDGLYLDDISYDRSVMMRARKILDRNRELQKRGGGLIDLHSWNESRDSRAGYANCALIFMESFPFVDRLWFGEGHPYDGPAEQTLAAISGIPFGSMGEMLQDGGNPWLGLTFGMTNRLGRHGEPRPIWKLWDQFGIADAEFIGWWDTSSPVTASAPEVKATLWKRAGRTLIALGNFGDKPVQTTLQIDWRALGLDPTKASLYAPEMQNFQPEALYRPDGKISLAPKRGLALWLDETPRKAPAPADTLALAKRRVLFEDRFAPKAAEGWTLTASVKAKPPEYDGSGQVFLAPANTYLWTARALAVEPRVVAAQFRQDTGDSAQQWGPGLALVWPDGKFVKANRRADGRIGLSINGSEKLAGQCDRELPVTLAVALDSNFVRIVATGEGAFGQEQELARIPRKDLSGAPIEVRVGKMPNSLKPQDYGDAGLMGWSRCDWLRVLGD